MFRISISGYGTTRWRHRLLWHYCWCFARGYICQDYILWTSIHQRKENGFILKKARNRLYPAQTITDADCTDDTASLANTPTQAKSLLHSQEQAAGGMGLYVKADQMEYMCFNQKGGINTLTGVSLKLEDKFMYLSRSTSSTENDINIHLAKAWTAIDRLLIILKSDLSNRIKCNFFQAAVMSILLYGFKRWMLTKLALAMQWAVLNKSWKQHPTKHQLYSHLPPISKTSQIRQTRHAVHGWRSQDELISDVLQWTPSQEHTSVG